MTTIETLEWTFQDRSNWPSGPWDGEPDKRQWSDPTTGLPCLIVRNHVGGLCGYVGVPEGHPAYGVDYDAVSGEWDEDYTDRSDAVVPGLDVHGGLTFSGSCQENRREEGICHVVKPGQPDKVWWLGFDCVHCGDRAPGMETYRGPFDGDTYKDVAYVTAECERLARCIADAS